MTTATATSQPLQALETANAVRVWREGARATVAALPHREGKLAVARLLTRRVPPRRTDYLATLPVYKILDWVYRWERRRTTGVLAGAGISSEMRAIGELTERQRHALADVLTDTNPERAE